MDWNSNSPTWRILNSEPENYSSQAQRIIEEWAVLDQKVLTRSELLKVLPGYEGLIVRLRHQIDREIIDAGRHLKAMVSATTGLDHIDVEYAQAKGIAVLSLQGEQDFLRQIVATAELSWGLLLALVRKIVPAALSVKGGDWDRNKFRGFDLQGKCLGILGLGRIGKQVASYGQAFGMEVGAYDPHVTEWKAGVIRFGEMERLLRRTDVLMIHVPLNQKTIGLIGEKELSVLPQGSVVVNTSRGEVVHEYALIEALEKGHIAGAALDVICGERRGSLHSEAPLMAYSQQNDHLLITPHIGGASFDAMAKTEIFMARKLTEFFKTVKWSLTTSTIATG